MTKKIIPIKYTSRDFESIKRDLIEHAKRYYPDSYKDFNEGSFGSLMFDTVAYIGDILSFYLDYQANETFLDTATEYNNVLKLAKQMGFKYLNGRSSACVATFYIEVPALPSTLGPDLSYAPTLKKGTSFSTNDRTKFLLNEDIKFSSTKNLVIPLRIDANKQPISYGIKCHGQVISGIIKTEMLNIGEFKRFNKLRLTEPNITEVLSIVDEEGNEYYEVDNLSQNIVYRSISNKDPATSELSKEILKPYLVPRRFTVETEINATYIQFGASDSDSLTSKNYVADPGNVVLEQYGKEYISSDTFDPSRLQNTDKLGIAPANTNVYVTYRYNPVGAMLNFGVNALTNVDNAIIQFDEEQNLSIGMMETVKASLEVNNDVPILGEVRSFDSKELKIKIKNIFSAQSRAVTAEDYKSLAYSMPTKYGAVKRINVVKDELSSKRNLNLYILCEDKDGYLCKSNEIVKTNLKTWLSKNKMINDSIDILDGKVVNYGIEFTGVASPDKSKYDVLNNAVEALRTKMEMLGDFGEPFFITDVWNVLKNVDGLMDVINVDIVPKYGTTYSSHIFDFDKSMSSDKRYLNVPLNVVMELKYPSTDIKGTII